MFNKFIPDFNNVLDASFNKKPARIPLYEHNISDRFMERILNKKFAHLLKIDLIHIAFF